MTRLRPGPALVVATCVALTLATGACGLSDDAAGARPDAAGSTPTSESPSASRSSSAADSPEAVLGLAGLQLPPGAGGAQVETRTGLPENVEEAYRVTFVVDRGAALGFCASGGLGGDLPAVALTADQTEALGVEGTPAQGSRICASQWPENPAWQRTVLIEPDDPTTVHVGLERWSR
ncbi:hypothetical protein [Phycicoccus flavus]|uniref:Lipoprotein n=1 Tax=Phycicoccus flavus TaxID=2502783 RepID=A0A8T6QZX2_9MICO|nr:hypothetical protein [Phycicoccus flavus]NHA67518.1 hypothetical protein [Phycicoccus flavus]